MVVFVVAVVVGFAAGLLSGGRLTAIADLRIRAWPILAGAVATQACLGHCPTAFRWVVAVADCAAITYWCVANCSSHTSSAGYGFVGLGVVANAVVIAVNQGMPVSRSALARAGYPASGNVADGHFYKHIFMTGHTVLSYFGDIFPLRLARTVLSPGDILMLLGIVLITCHATQTCDRLAADGTTGQFVQSDTDT